MKTESQKAQEVAALLNGTPPSEGEAEPSPEAGEEAPSPAPTGKPKTFAELAERLEMKPSELYDLELTTGDGESVKIGTLKDAYQGREAAARETAERAAALDERETAIIADQRIWNEMGNDLAKAIPPQRQQELANHLRERERVERSKLLETAPDLQDPAKFDQFRDDAANLLVKSYGFKPHEIAITDHRQILMIRDLIRAKKTIEELKKWTPKAAPPNSAASKGRGGVSQTSQVVSKGKRSRHEADKVKAVGALLKG